MEAEDNRKIKVEWDDTIADYVYVLYLEKEWVSFGLFGRRKTYWDEIARSQDVEVAKRWARHYRIPLPQGRENA